VRSSVLIRVTLVGGASPKRKEIRSRQELSLLRDDTRDSPLPCP